VVCVALFSAFIIVLTWLKARGNFIFTDCVARNRAAIVAPWREYRREGNSYFLFLLLVVFGGMMVFGLLCLFGFWVFGIFGQYDITPAMMPLFIVFLVLFFIAWLCFAFFFGLTSYFIVPVMYIHRCRAVVAFCSFIGFIWDNGGSFL